MISKKLSIKDWIKYEQGKHFCKCGCGGEIIIKVHHHHDGIPEFIHGHNKRLLPEDDIIGKWVDENQGKHFCLCGCNGEIIIKRHHYNVGIPEFIHGHNSQVIPKSVIDAWIKDNQGKHVCHCGCNGEIIIKKIHYRIGIPKYISTHNVDMEDNKKVVGDKNRVNTINYWENLPRDDYEDRCREMGYQIIAYRDSLSEDELKLLFNKISIGKQKWWDNLSEDDRKLMAILISCGQRGIDIEDFDDFNYNKFNERRGPEYKEWHRLIRERYNYTCQMCNDYGCHDGGLTVHHIFPVYLYPELILDPDNGIVLCKRCHYKVNTREMDYIEFFLNIKNNIINPFI